MAAQTAQVFLLFDLINCIIMAQLRQHTSHRHILRFSYCFRRIPAVQFGVWILNIIFLFLMHLIHNFDLGALLHNLIVNHLLHFLQPTKLDHIMATLGTASALPFYFFRGRSGRLSKKPSELSNLYSKDARCALILAGG
jgi:hypothetical protein